VNPEDVDAQVVFRHLMREYDADLGPDARPRPRAIKQMQPRTFELTNYCLIYDVMPEPDHVASVLAAMRRVILLYGKRHGVDHQRCRRFYQSMEEEVQRTIVSQTHKHTSNAPFRDFNRLCEYMWTSAHKLKGIKAIEFCTILNDVIRDDIAEEVVHAAVIARAINAQIISRVAHLVHDTMNKWPPGGVCWRGGGFKDEFRSFFTPKRLYRIPAFLATAFDKAICDRFIRRMTDPSLSPVRWKIMLDPRGEKSYAHRCKQAGYVSCTHVPGEEEYLFCPYSVFTVKTVEWGDGIEPHEITIEAFQDNRRAGPNLPLAPWS